jgi:hypothetical protein
MTERRRWGANVRHRPFWGAALGVAVSRTGLHLNLLRWSVDLWWRMA